MAIGLDHILVPARDRRAAARRIAELLGAPWSTAGVGSPVCVNDGLTLDFDHRGANVPKQHCCSRVTQQEFGAILGRIRVAGITCRSLPHGPMDMQVETARGGSIVCREEPAGHVRELPVRSYARRPAAG